MKEISFIGRSIIELYVEVPIVQKVKVAMDTFVGANIFVQAKDIDSFQGGIYAGPELAKRIESRAKYLLARNPGKGIRTCILKGASEDRYATLVQEADALRNEWETHIRPPHEGTVEGQSAYSRHASTQH